MNKYSFSMVTQSDQNDSLSQKVSILLSRLYIRKQRGMH